MIFSSIAPRDDLSEMIHCFILDAVARNNNSIETLEIEAKFGLILEKSTNERVQLPVFSECVLNFEGWTCFISDMPVSLHRTFNEALNKGFANRSLGWKYAHTKTVDHILPNKTRVTMDATSGAILNAQRKQKLGDLEIFQPNGVMDIRISVNAEIQIPIESVKNEISHPSAIKRKKDRVSYEVANGLLSVDLTQVTQNEGNGNQIKHELELEVKNPELLLKDPEAFNTFVASIRELSRLIKRN